MLPVISEFKQITIGGAINGLAGESSSFRHGLIDDIVIKYEIVSTNGTILTVTPTNIHSELFYSLPGSYGTLGIITQIWLRIELTGKYVKVDYSKYNSLDRVTEEFKKETTESEYQFIEGIVLDKRTVIVSKAQTVKNIGWYDWLFCTSWFGYFWSKWYFNHVSDLTRKNNNYYEYIPIKDYLFRWDRGAFWFASNRLKCTWLNRIMYGSQLTSLKLYQRAQKKNILDREKRKIVQDLMIPLNKMTSFVESVSEVTEVYPLWLCPIKTPCDNQNKLFSLPNNGEVYVDIGVYGGWPKEKTIDGQTDFIERNQRLENTLFDNGGTKVLCNMNYFTKDIFWNIYSKNKYQRLRERYDHENHLLDIYDKVCSFYQGILNKIK